MSTLFSVSDIEQDGRLPGGLLQGLGNVLDHVPGILVEHGIMLHDQEAMVVLLQDGHELKGRGVPAVGVIGLKRDHTKDR